MSFFSVDNLSINFGGIKAVDGVTFDVGKGEVFTIIGPNGAGKTTIFNLVSRIYQPTGGKLVFDGTDITNVPPHRIAALGIARTFQNIELFEHATLLQNLLLARHAHKKSNFFSELMFLPSVRQMELEHREAVEKAIDFLDLQSVRKAQAGTLSYGLRKRVELARAMALEPRLILLDEPMAGMNFEEKEDMARYIVDLNEEFGMTVVMIEHDMGVVMDISHRVMVLDFGRKIAEGDPGAVLADPHVRRAYLGEEDEVLVDPDDAPPAQESAA